MSDDIKVTRNNFKYAAWHVRLRSEIIDTAIIYLFVFLVIPNSFKITSLLAGQHFYETLLFLVSFDGMWFWILPAIYLFLFWGFFSRSPGQMIMKVRIATVEGKNIGWLTAALRTFGIILASLPFCLGFLPILFTEKKQGLHDKLTKTIVVLKR
jgi:uncharacterized RDD family membrane protein YckC